LPQGARWRCRCGSHCRILQEVSCAMICKKCGGSNFDHGVFSTRKIKTLTGEKTERREWNVCGDCGRTAMPESFLAPVGSHYGQDVIDKIRSLRREGMTYAKIKTYFAENYQIKMAVSTAATIIQRYGDKR
jgi:hypothetical protein